jgi:hypothetical protein
MGATYGIDTNCQSIKAIKVRYLNFQNISRTYSGIARHISSSAAAYHHVQDIPLATPEDASDKATALQRNGAI